MRRYDLLVILDDATSEIYYAQLVEEESTATVMTALREVIERKGALCALYSDRASHFFHTPKAGQPVDRTRPTQVGRALQELGIPMIPAYSPQARGRSERSFGTWQGRLPQELRLHGIQSLASANEFLRETYIAEFNQRFAVAAAQPGHAFLPVRGKNLDLIFSVQHERTVGQDNTVHIGSYICRSRRPSGAPRWQAVGSPSTNTWIEPGVSATARTSWGVTTGKDYRCCWRKKISGGQKLWKRRALCALGNRSAIPTSPQPQTTKKTNPYLPSKPDISPAMKTGHFNLLTTHSLGIGDRRERNCPILRIFAAIPDSDVIGAISQMQEHAPTYLLQYLAKIQHCLLFRAAGL
jgi:hypothetical protein